MNDNNTIEEKIRKEKLKETTVSIDPHAAKPGPATIQMTDGVLIPKKGEKHIFTSWRLTFFGALALSAILLIFFPDPYRQIFTDEQWATYLKNGAAKQQKAREKRKMKAVKAEQKLREKLGL